MDYKIYKFNFPNGVHFGINSLVDTKSCFSADTFFSAMCIEALKIDNDIFDNLISFVNENKLLFSDSFPYIGSKLFIPKPNLFIPRKKKDDEDDSVVKKKYKKLDYICVDNINDYMDGNYPEELFDALSDDNFGKKSIRTLASIRGMEETEPYRLSIFNYNEDNDAGVYIYVGYTDDKALGLFEEIMDSMETSGLGGKKYSGLGNFSCYGFDIPDDLKERLTDTYDINMTLSVSLPTNDELDNVVEDASYLLDKKGGFIASYNYTSEYTKKKDLFMFESGSCFKNKYIGDIYDVSIDGNHPVYKYGKAMFIGLK